MSDLSGRILEGVQHVANYLAYLAGRGEAPDPASDVYQRLTQGLSAGDIALAVGYAASAEALRQAMLAADPGTRLQDLPEWAAVAGLTPVAHVVHVYTEQLPEGAGREPHREYRTDPYALGGMASQQYLFSSAAQRDAETWYSFDGDYEADYELREILPFDLYV